MHPVADIYVADQTHLAGQHDIATDLGGAGYTDLSDNNGIFTNYDIVGDHDEIVDFYSPADPGFPQSTAIDGAIGTDFHIVLDDDDAELGNFIKCGAIRSEAEAIGPNYRATVNDNTISQNAVIIHGDIGVESRVSTDGYTLTENHSREKINPVTQGNIITD